MSFGGRLNPNQGWRPCTSALAAWSSGRVFCMRRSNCPPHPIFRPLFLADEAAVRLLARLPSGASRKICGTKTEEIRMGGRGKADRQAPRFAHREDEGVVVGSQQSDEKEEGVKKAPCACRWELLSPLSTL